MWEKARASSKSTPGVCVRCLEMFSLDAQKPAATSFNLMEKGNGIHPRALLYGKNLPDPLFCAFWISLSPRPKTVTQGKVPGNSYVNPRYQTNAFQEE